MENFCGGPLWDTNLTWNTTNEPDFTPCFQETVLAWIPCIFLWVFTPLNIYSVYHRERSYTPITLLNLFKSFLSMVLCIMCAIELVEALIRGESVPQVNYITPIIKSFTYILVFGLVIFHRNRGAHTSGLLFLFWLLTAVVSVINYRSLLRSTFYEIPQWNISEIQFTIRTVYTPIVIIQLVLSSVADKRAEFLHTGEDVRNRSPEIKASILSTLTFWWLNSFMIKGYKRPLTEEDIYQIRFEDKTETNAQRFDALIDPLIKKAVEEGRNPNEFQPLMDGKLIKHKGDRVNGASPNHSRQPTRAPDGEAKAKYVGIVTVLLRAYWPDLILAGLLRLLANLLTFSSPLLLDKLITFVKGQEPTWRGVLYSLTLFGASMLESVLNNQQEYMTSVIVMKMKTCLTSVIYRKTLRLSNHGRKNYNTGEIVNMMSVDTARVTDFVQNCNIIWSAPLQILISLYLLYLQLGIAVVAGLGVMIFAIPLNGWIASKIKVLQMAVMRFKDKRIKLLSEILNGIKILKLHAWEEAFGRRIEKIRSDEIKSLTQQTWYSTGITFAFTCMPFFVALASFATFVLLSSENILDANKAFVSLSLFNILRVPLALLPMLITYAATFLVSVRRLNKYLEGDEISGDSIERLKGDDTTAIKIEEGHFSWGPGEQPVLNNINVKIPKHKLVAVVGPVGSGKSSLLSAILGDLEKIRGRVLIDPSISMSYVPQEAWILNQTFRDNILFTKLANEDRYRKVVDACALGPDLKTFNLGDYTEIGEKGINLSGGQKQRVSLARAVYADTDVYLLDDPMNAVDSHVGRHIFDHVIGPKGLLRDRTRLLITNKLSILPHVDHILVMKDGQISESGSYNDLLKARGLFSQLLVKYLLENSVNKNLSEDDKDDVISNELKRLNDEADRKVNSEQASKMRISVQKNPEETVAPSKSASGPGGITEREVAQVGSVSLDVHLRFVRTMGINFVVALVIYIISSVFTIGTNLWLSEWSNDALNSSNANNTQLRDLRLGVYAGLGIAETICVLTSTLLLNLACLKSSKLLHNSMLRRVLKAPMSWFNVTPAGRIVNRFTKDVDTIDVTIRFNVRLLIIIALRSLISLILISVGSWYIIIPIVPIVVMYFLFQMFYVATSRQVKRLESLTKSPIYSHFGETVVGTSSIRAFGVTQQFILESNHRVDVNNSSYYMSIVASRWLAVRLEFLGYLIVFMTAMLATYSRGSISPGIAGLSVTYALSVTAVLSMLVRTYSDFETNVVCIERLIEYTKTPIEDDNQTEPEDPNWPDKGCIRYDDYCARYRPELDLVLRKIDLKVAPAERVGFVGRTGAGKSSITLSLFRIFEPANGTIFIDDVDITKIGLKHLRSRISIIPQDPVMFAGTVRQNIDPCEDYSDDEIWKALDLAHLGSFVRSLNMGLDHEVGENGNNFSVGQKQLFCLSRTLLRRSRILVLDEATAAVDVETDDLIQKTIRKEFNDSTILTIAHRLETIQDYDRVIVMDGGKVTEQGAPKSLMNLPYSKYKRLAEEAGLIGS